MYYLIFKTIISAVIIVAVTELSKLSSLTGGILASVPLISVLAFIWLYIETGDVQKISNLSYDIFWLVIPSLSLFLLLPFFLKLKINFYGSLSYSLVLMIIIYYLQIIILRKLGIKI